MKNLIVLPSYNERENLVNLIKDILETSTENFVCVVDDNSPDGTSQLVKSFIEQNVENRCHLITRAKKDGRGGAVRDGFLWGLNNTEYNFENFIEMDCDYSHPPTDIKKGVDLLSDNQVCIGARYPDGKIEGWPLSRKILSFCANFLAKLLISFKIQDYTNGFRFYNREVVKLLCERPQKNKGYIYLSETIAYCLKQGHSIAFFPILFVNRERGVSNTSFREVFSAFYGIFTIAWDYHFGSNNTK